MERATWEGRGAAPHEEGVCVQIIFFWKVLKDLIPIITSFLRTSLRSGCQLLCGGFHADGEAQEAREDSGQSQHRQRNKETHRDSQLPGSGHAAPGTKLPGAC